MELVLIVIGHGNEGNIVYFYRLATEAHSAQWCKLLATLAISENLTLHDEKKVIPIFMTILWSLKKNQDFSEIWGEFLRMKILKDKDPYFL